MVSENIFLPFLGKFGQKKKQNDLFKVKFCTQTKSNMLNLMAVMVMLTFFFGPKISKLTKIVCFEMKLDT